ncbi:cysteine desulfurase NifS [Candidatus Berkelbacteria bacterium CG10_big_fil_rev_8_21_14_0_10_41_12]|uniref:cysteine desulfurase n=1 Tax=Candidatus Berkelbacteria bacterium CG10_big_fil_rev_8_21_14_0_10_41_12 TaxID=1974513 RepID=A0A2M6WX24_9BACT|nr:MAG: cysteine desulfurase NifS [Candidatus Berkelbacteria bacterium CG10_big_fil_rev_8_21_14_0_10_41_12]
MKRIYLDNAATTPVKPEVFEAMKPYFSRDFGNASSIHSDGQQARATVEQARHEIVEVLNCKDSEVVFTSGGSESDNLAIRGIVESAVGTRRLALGGWQKNPQTADQLPHVITSAFEHHAVLKTVQMLEKSGEIKATYVKPDKEGLIAAEDVKAAIRENTVLVSIMYVNNEIGTIQSIREIGKMLEKLNSARSEASTGRRIYFHCDAIQAAEYLNLDTKYLHVDLMTLSAHKIFGPKGIGLLFMKSGVKITPQITGGEQEWRLRSGTENVAGIVGFAKAMEIIQNAKCKIRNYNSKTEKLRDKLIDGILDRIPKSRLNGSRERRSPANVNVSFFGAEGESILINLDLAGISASSGSACTSGALEPSHVLEAIGVKPEWSHGSVRFSLSPETKEKEIDYLLEELPKIIEKLRKMSPIK